jgi:cation transport ATPase
VPGGNENDLLARAAAVEANSEHPLAKAIVAEAKRRNLPTQMPLTSKRCLVAEHRHE